MRIWSLHPGYLDAKGLVALWRETLLAKKVLEGNTKGYVNHPQLNRFRASGAAIDVINFYLSEVFEEARKRMYNFDKSKFRYIDLPAVITVTQGQMDYELQHLLNKLKLRDVLQYNQVVNNTDIKPHPLFNVIPGAIESWEITTDLKNF